MSGILKSLSEKRKTERAVHDNVQNARKLLEDATQSMLQGGGMVEEGAWVEFIESTDRAQRTSYRAQKDRSVARSGLAVAQAQAAHSKAMQFTEFQRSPSGSSTYYTSHGIMSPSSSAVGRRSSSRASDMHQYSAHRPMPSQIQPSAYMSPSPEPHRSSYSSSSNGSESSYMREVRSSPSLASEAPVGYGQYPTQSMCPWAPVGQPHLAMWMPANPANYHPMAAPVTPMAPPTILVHFSLS